MQNLISYIQKKGYSIETYGTGNTKPLLKWGEIYYSDANKDKIYPSFYLYFKDTPVKITRYKMQTAENQPFPIKWSLSISYDNKSFNTIISDINDNNFCPEDHQTNPEGYYLLCNEKLVKNYSITTKHEHAKYFKFDMKKNSYNNDSNWPYLLTLTGFEIEGSFLIQFSNNKCTKYPIFRIFSFFIFIFIFT